MKRIAQVAIIAITINCLMATDEIKMARLMYSNDRAWKVGDILTVVVNESMGHTKSDDIKTGKTASANSSAPTMASAHPNNVDSGSFNVRDPNIGRQAFNNFTNLFNQIPAYTVDATSSYSGSGSSSSGETLTMTIAVRVVDVLDNETLVIRGDKRLKMHDESVKLIVTGLVRPVDISATNSVNSNQIADTYIVYESDGEVTRGTKSGFVWRILQYISPF